MTFDKGSRAVQWGNSSFLTDYIWATDIHMQKKLGWTPTSHTMYTN